MELTIYPLEGSRSFHLKLPGQPTTILRMLRLTLWPREIFVYDFFVPLKNALDLAQHDKLEHDLLTTLQKHLYYRQRNNYRTVHRWASTRPRLVVKLVLHLVGRCERSRINTFMFPDRNCRASCFSVVESASWRVIRWKSTRYGMKGRSSYPPLPPKKKLDTRISSWEGSTHLGTRSVDHCETTPIVLSRRQGGRSENMKKGGGDQ